MYKNINIATASIASASLIGYLHSQSILQKVWIPQEYGMIVPYMQSIVGAQKVDQLTNQNIASLEGDLTVLMGYPHKVTLSEDSAPIMNVHFGKLPENKGPDPVFRTLSENMSNAFVSIHEVTETFDSGAILKEKSMPIMPIDNYGILMAKLGQLTVEAFHELLQGQTTYTQQDEASARYFQRPTEQETMINWKSMSKEAISRLIKACNPQYGGAKTTMSGAIWNILEASGTSYKHDAQPGTILESNPQRGIIVACKDEQAISLDLISLAEGYFTGRKIAEIRDFKGITLS